MSLLVGNESAQIMHSSWQAFGLRSGCPDPGAEKPGRLGNLVPPTEASTGFSRTELRLDLLPEKFRSWFATFAGVWDSDVLGAAGCCDDLLLNGLARRWLFSAS